jgi:chitinase
VDYEYPGNDEQARGYVELLRELRRGLDWHAQKKGANYRFLLTVRCLRFPCLRLQLMCTQIAAPCGPDNYQKLHVRAMDEVLDLWNLMTYDFGEGSESNRVELTAKPVLPAAGSWEKTAGHQANLYGQPISGHQAISWYIQQGVHPSKASISVLVAYVRV